MDASKDLSARLEKGRCVCIAAAGCVSGRTRVKSPACLGELRASFAGSIMEVDSELAASAHLYGKLQSGPRPVFPPAVPRLIAVCTNSRDALQAVQWALMHGMKSHAKGSGHHWAGVALAHGGLTVDLSQLQDVKVDEDARVVTIQPGVNAMQVLSALTPRNLFTSVPNLDEVGMGGYVLGGGMGDNTKVIGFGCDNAVSFEAVVADGAEARLVTVDAEHEPELFWGLRGAGSNLALVTSMSLRLHPFVPSTTLLKASFPMQRAPQVLDFWRRHDPALPKNHVSMVSFSSSPDFIRTVNLREQLWASSLDADDTDTKLLRDAVDFAESTGALVPAVPVKTPYSELRKFALPHDLAVYVADLFLTGVNDEVMQILSSIASASTSSMSIVSLVRASTADDDAGSHTAFGWRGKPYVSIMALWRRTPQGAAHDGDAEHIAWARSAYKQLQPHMAGRYINTVMFDNDNDTQLCYEPKDWERLKHVKQRYDPSNLFRDLSFQR